MGEERRIQIDSFENIDSVETYLINAIIKAKSKESKVGKRLWRAGLYVLASVAGFMFYLSTQWGTLTEGPTLLAGVASDPVVLVFMTLLGISYVNLQNIKFKFEKAEKDYDQLKEDMIDRASEIWSTPEKWKERARIFNELKTKYDINIYHK
ncbi:DUF2663 family protein [Salipaludibacillus sp. HK11]|uniref:DUF2663 family protein n=1 Tax=Salipaludibacillus sp. HK11 TaxID=3394320 RepID=UPI0039FD09EC